MDVVIRKVGNSTVVTLPSEITNRINIKIGDRVSMDVENDTILIRPVKKRLKGEAFLESYYGKPYSQIKAIKIETENVDTGAVVGEEVW